MDVLSKGRIVPVFGLGSPLPSEHEIFDVNPKERGEAHRRGHAADGEALDRGRRHVRGTLLQGQQLHAASEARAAAASGRVVRRALRSRVQTRRTCRHRDGSRPSSLRRSTRRRSTSSRKKRRATDVRSRRTTTGRSSRTCRTTPTRRARDGTQRPDAATRRPGSIVNDILATDGSADLRAQARGVRRRRERRSSSSCRPCRVPTGLGRRVEAANCVSTTTSSRPLRELTRGIPSVRRPCTDPAPVTRSAGIARARAACTSRSSATTGCTPPRRRTTRSWISRLPALETTTPMLGNNLVDRVRAFAVLRRVLGMEPAAGVEGTLRARPRHPGEGTHHASLRHDVGLARPPVPRVRRDVQGAVDARGRSVVRRTTAASSTPRR